MEEDLKDEFKTTLMGGYDKEDVQARVKELNDEHYAEKSRLSMEIEQLQEQLKEKDAVIAEKNAEIEKLNRDIEEKYQGYIDHYDMIGKIVYETRLQSDKTLATAKEQSEKIIAQANEKAQSSIDKAQTEVEKKLADGRRRYNVLQEEINDLIQLVNQVQHKFMQSFKAIHSISGAMNDETGDIEVDFDESFEDGGGDGNNEEL